MLPRDVPGRWEVLLEEVARGEAEQTLSDGTRRLPGQTLAELRSRLGGDEGELGDPRHGRHRVSLARWRDADPQTRLRVSFIFTPDRPLPADVARRMRIERTLLRAAMPASEAEARTLPELVAEGEAVATAAGRYWAPRPAPSCAPRR